MSKKSLAKTLADLGSKSSKKSDFDLKQPLILQFSVLIVKGKSFLTQTALLFVRFLPIDGPGRYLQCPAVLRVNH
jgi:hypothetical protein